MELTRLPFGAVLGESLRGEYEAELPCLLQLIAELLVGIH